MTRFVFDTRKGADKVFNSDDMKAKMAFILAGEIIDKRDDNMPLLVLLTFEIGTGGLTHDEIAQFLYDNYDEHQLTGLHIAVADKEKMKTITKHFETEEELEEIRKEVRNMNGALTGGDS